MTQEHLEVDPDIGSRNWTDLVKIDTMQRDNRPLAWRTDSGDRPTDEYLASVGYAGLIQTPPPPYDPHTQRVEKLPWEVIDGVITETWQIIELTEAEMAAYAADHKASLIERAAELRWSMEVSGVLWNDLLVATDRDSQSKIIAERLAIEAGERDDGDSWKFADGVFRPLTNLQFIQMAGAVRNWVKMCFGVESYILDLIDSGTISSVEDVDNAFTTLQS